MENRARQLLEELESLLFIFIDRNKVSHEEFRVATDTILATVKSGEESMMFDVLLGARVMDNSNALKRGSIEGIEGPFYVPNAPQLVPPCVLPQRSDEPGEACFFQGSVKGLDGLPLKGVEVDIWQADADGLYSNFHVGPPDWNLRGRIYTDEDGRFDVRTVLPPPYEIPHTGPTGSVLKAMGRHFFRAAHFHVKVRYPGFREINSLVYLQGDEYLASDAANAVRDTLIAKVTRSVDASSLVARGTAKPFYEVRYDFILDPS